eukprot:CAMPEP_0170602182 /NCGR_PEP_ID=MMETSP0224-20130122/18255_1 /TAXON_ID=285029 /ORGANISM="Togula jolla, Strain CCCM 725" /LENGTH=327 /DNA_ID=CAMNT_0010927005 /DNA_START=52 /DNA_END=1031 /DNA_ORIENTATION=+
MVPGGVAAGGGRRSLADELLSREVDRELEAMDQELQQQLAEFRRQHQAGGAGGQRSPEDLSARAGDSARERKAADSVREPRAVAAGEASLGSAAAPARHSVSDDMLSRAAAMTGQVDQELQAMEEELQEQLSKLSRQREGSQAEKTRPTDEKADVAAPGATATKQADVSDGNFEQEALIVEAKQAEVDVPELAALRAEAGMMNEAFPEPSPSDGVEGPVASTRRPARWWSERATDRQVQAERERDAVPADEEALELKGMLEGLELRLRSLQQQEAALDIPDTSRSAGLVGNAKRSVEELQAQNKHLRERLQASGSSNLLNLDKALFS